MNPPLWKRVLPFGISLLYLLGIYLVLLSPFNVQFIGIMFLYLIPPAGKESMVPAGVFLLRSTYGIYSIVISATSMAFVDFVVALFLYYNWDLVESIPLLGKWIKKFEEKQSKILSGKKIKKHLAYIFLALFVAFPFQGTGGVGGTIVGRLIGLSARETLITITAGSLFGCYLIASLAYASGEIIEMFQKTKNIFLILSLIIFLSIFALFIYFVYKNVRKRALNSQ